MRAHRPPVGSIAAVSSAVLLDDLPRLPAFELVAPGTAEADAAHAAFVAFGKGSGHPAGLNFGDVQLCAGQGAGPAVALQGR